MKRLHTLDYLRGMAAAGIMVFHYMSWTFGEFDASDFMGRVGIYGVAIFYVLSGLTLFHVYESRLSESLAEVLDFFKKRALRIFPLLWVATILSIFIVQGGSVNLYNLILNLTGIFGFIDWSNSIAIGAWSIGNELVFYCFLPIFVWLHRRQKTVFWIFSATLLGVYVYFAYFLIDASKTFTDLQQRLYYFNPLNQVFLFLSGYLIGALLSKESFKTTTSLVYIAAGLILFILYPAEGSRLQLVAGHARMAFTISCILVCIGFYKFNAALPLVISMPLKNLGEISYSVYMLHPLVHILLRKPFDFVREHYFPVSEAWRFFSAIIITLVLSYLVYQYFEKYFIRLGKTTIIQR